MFRRVLATKIHRNNNRNPHILISTFDLTLVWPQLLQDMSKVCSLLASHFKVSLLNGKTTDFQQYQSKSIVPSILLEMTDAKHFAVNYITTRTNSFIKADLQLLLPHYC